MSVGPVCVCMCVCVRVCCVGGEGREWLSVRDALKRVSECVYVLGLHIGKRGVEEECIV